MPTVRGREEVARYFASLPDKIARNLLPGAARAAAKVVAAEAEQRCVSSEVRGAIKVRVKRGDDQVVGRVEVRGPGAFMGPWLEWGTAPHLITVDASQSGGRTAGRINRLAKENGGNHSLVIGGKFVGDTVMHPGARPHPFLRPALDTKEAEAFSAAQGFITAKLARSGLAPESDGDGA